MKKKSKVVWQEGMSFTAHLDDFEFMIDADEQFGGKNKGPKPKGLTLVSLAGCTGMDVIAILKKMRVSVDHFEVTTDADLADEHPMKYDRILLTYIFEGKDLPPDKIKKAVSLSEERYCGVSATLKPQVEIVNEIVINGQKVD